MAQSGTKRASVEHSIDEQYVAQLREWTPDAAATVYDERIRTLERHDKMSFAERGLIMLEMETRELWKYLSEPFTSLSDWIYRAAPLSHGTCRAALKAARALNQVIPLEEQKEIPRCNLETLSKCSTKVAERPDIREAAKGSNKDLVDKIKREHPEQHLEHKKPMRFQPEESARTVIDEAIDMAMVLEEAESREEALECIAEYYASAHRPRYERERRERQQVTAEVGLVQ